MEVARRDDEADQRGEDHQRHHAGLHQRDEVADLGRARLRRGGAAGALNMWYDADIDILMARTANRPIPAGRVTRGEALAFGLTLAVFSVVLLGLAVNLLSAALLAFTIFFYAVVFTMWLKRSTSQNIVIGGAAGAIPPMIGWAAKTGSLALDPVLLFLIIFFWTPPHFWALALSRAQEYARAGVPMLPVTAGEAATRNQILAYTVLLAPLGVTPWAFGTAGALYGVVSVVAGLFMLALALRVWRPGSAERALHTAGKRLFGFSILYLFILFAALLADQGLRGIGWL
jgi:protoheme IX farnesyltransferase